MIEEWRPIKGYEGLYEVSNTGLVRNVVKGRYLKPGFDKNGYLKCVLSKGGKQRTVYIHRLVATAFIPNPDGLPQVNHRDEDKTRNVVDNLEWCTSKYNVNYGSAQERRVQKNIENGNYSGSKTADIREYKRLYMREYRKRNKEYNDKQREYMREYMREYWKKNKEMIMERNKEYLKEYRKKNRERINEKNRERMREYMKEYRSKKKE